LHRHCFDDGRRPDSAQSERQEMKTMPLTELSCEKIGVGSEAAHRLVLFTETWCEFIKSIFVHHNAASHQSHFVGNCRMMRERRRAFVVED